MKMLEAFGHRARMVTVNAGGHGSYLVNGNACGDNAVTAFLTQGTHQNISCNPCHEGVAAEARPHFATRPSMRQGRRSPNIARKAIIW